MHWLLDPIKNDYVNFTGRVTRQTYWMFILWVFGIYIVLIILGLDIVGLLVSFGLILPSLGLAVRRLHDTNRSGWWYLLSFIPILGAIILIVFLAQDSQAGDNAYGPNPKMASSPEIPSPEVSTAQE